MEPRRARNPILPGYHPNPSICRVGLDYYLVTSTHEYFPGLPVYHSRDLVNWRLAGHVLDRPGQLPLDGVPASGGLLAPSIRHAGGVWYVVCTLSGGQRRAGNFVVTAQHPLGPWSQPVWLDGAPGFDPSLYFGSDGRAWFTATRPHPGGGRAGRTQIWLREFDRDGLRLTGPEHALFSGALVDAVWAEGPHIFRRNGYYYLLLAEGGTGYHHAVTVARSEKITGPYHNNPANPVLTHRHLGRQHPVAGAGHADLVQTPAGDWYAVLHAIRPYGGYFYNLGRETFLASVTWEDDWPIMNPGAGQLLAEFPAPLPAHPCPLVPSTDDFDGPTLAPQWSFLRTPRETFASLAERPGHLRLRLRPETLSDAACPSFAGRRQQHRDFTASLAVDFEPGGRHECAGLVALRGTGRQIRLVITSGAAPGSRAVRAEVCRDGPPAAAAQAPIPAGRVYLMMQAAGQDYSLRFSQDQARWHTLATVDGRLLSPATGTDFTGAHLGMYASSNGQASQSTADFDWFTYHGHD